MNKICVLVCIVACLLTCTWANAVNTEEIKETSSINNDVKVEMCPLNIASSLGQCNHNNYNNNNNNNNSQSMCCHSGIHVKCCSVKGQDVVNTCNQSTLNSDNINFYHDDKMMSLLEYNQSSPTLGYMITQREFFVAGCGLFLLLLIGVTVTAEIGRRLAQMYDRHRIREKLRQSYIEHLVHAQKCKRTIQHTEEAMCDPTVECVICSARHIDIALDPCKHVCVCHECSQRLVTCPICRMKVASFYCLPRSCARAILASSSSSATTKPTGSESSVSPSEFVPQEDERLYKREEVYEEKEMNCDEQNNKQINVNDIEMAEIVNLTKSANNTS